jgi:hypothetical protein
MTFDLQKILESKRALRRHLAARPIAEKLRVLDALREPELAIRNRAVRLDPTPSSRRKAPNPRRAKPE